MDTIQFWNKTWKILGFVASYVLMAFWYLSQNEQMNKITYSRISVQIKYKT